ncbi:hypothetical protein [Cloacibacterium sp.]|uniref:hypothetical protein n=1 Tax=Cloacibacterium sp. TaxID=1913682 RepID=UPI0035B2E658
MNKMKKLYTFIFLIITIFLNAQNTEETLNKFLNLGGIVSIYTKIDNEPILSEENLILYSEKEEKILIGGNHINEYSAKLDRTYNEQGFYIKEYIPTNLDTSVKRIFKFCYTQNTNEPVVVVEISYTSVRNYTITKYFTKKWAELTNYN